MRWSMVVQAGDGEGAFDRSDKEADVMLREGQMGRVLTNSKYGK